LLVRLVDDRLDGARAAAAFGAAAKAIKDLLGIAQRVAGRVHGMANIVVAEDIAGTDDHETLKRPSDAAASIWDGGGTRWKFQKAKMIERRPPWEVSLDLRSFSRNRYNHLRRPLAAGPTEDTRAPLRAGQS
jgi:hypothetical protein